MKDEKDLGAVSATAGDTGPCLVPADAAPHVGHTPTPWVIEAGTDGIIRGSADDRWIAKTSVSDPSGWDTDAANAAFIVRACNNHEEILAALKLMVHSAVPHPGEHKAMYAAWEVAHKAIAKAEGR